MALTLSVEKVVAIVLLSATCALVSVGFLGFAYVWFAEEALCIPGVSIECRHGDCGRSYVRCGYEEVYQVPDKQVCYKGALLPSESTSLHSCVGYEHQNTSTVSEPATVYSTGCTLPSGKNCYSACTGNTQRCNCLCRTSPCLPVTCGNGRSYNNKDVASCFNAHNCNAIVRPWWMKVRNHLLASIQTLVQPFRTFFNLVHRSLTFPKVAAQSCCSLDCPPC